MYKRQAQDIDAFLRYTMTQNLNRDIRLRLFQSGPGTFWTNLGSKDMNLFLPMPMPSNTPATPTTPARSR